MPLPIRVRTFMSKNAMPMVFYAGKSAQLLGAPPQTPVFGGRGGFAPLTPIRRLESSVPGPSWGLSVPLFSLLEMATLVVGAIQPSARRLPASRNCLRGATHTAVVIFWACIRLWVLLLILYIICIIALSVCIRCNYCRLFVIILLAEFDSRRWDRWENSVCRLCV